MPGFLYFAPDRSLIQPSDLAGLGLAYIASGTLHSTGCQRGPTGGPGLTFASEGFDPGQCRYDAASQTWRPIPGSPCWVGHYQGQLPGPDDLARPQQLGGSELILADGQPWLVPVARGLRASDDSIRYINHLPQRLDLAADGQWVYSGVLPAYAALWELAEGWFEVIAGSPTEALLARFDAQGAVNGAVLCLQANYRIGRAEAALLGILTDDLVNAILDRLVDRAVLVGFLQKKTTAAVTTAPPLAGSSSSAGPADSIPATDPPSPIVPP